MTYPLAPLTPTQPKSLDRRLAVAMAQRAADGLARRCPPIAAHDAPAYELDGRPVIGFCSNDYLGFAQEPPRPSESSGATGSRLVTGHGSDLRGLEAQFAAEFGFESAVLFPSGYQANVSALSCLLQADDTVFSDRLNHASLIDGMRLSKAAPQKIDHLAQPGIVAHTTTWWITESRFSMDGDGPSPEDLDSFSSRGGTLYLDEAHTFGLGPQGHGLAQRLRTIPAVTVIPLGKAAGASGAFVAGSATLCEYLRTTARGVVYSTAPSPPLVQAVRGNLERIAGPLGDVRRQQLRARMQQLRSALAPFVPSAGHGSGPIVPVVVGSNQRALAVSARLLDAGFHVQPIRYPTVPKGEARLRLTVTALHEPDHIDRLAAALEQALSTEQP